MSEPSFPAFGVCFNLLVPQFFPLFVQPVGHGVNLLGFKLGDGGFNFLHRPHGGNRSFSRAAGKFGFLIGFLIGSSSPFPAKPLLTGVPLRIQNRRLPDALHPGKGQRRRAISRHTRPDSEPVNSRPPD
jgi:hypothetical protein